MFNVGFKFQFIFTLNARTITIINIKLRKNLINLQIIHNSSELIIFEINKINFAGTKYLQCFEKISNVFVFVFKKDELQIK